MILNTVQLRQKAHELALTHDPLSKRSTISRFWTQFHTDVEELQEFVQVLRTQSMSCSQPAEEWLLDNAEFIDEQVVVVKQQLSDSFLKRLIYLKDSGKPRILSLCDDYLEHVDGNFDENSFVSYITSYQEVSVLTISETWAIPLIMRVALIRYAAKVMRLVRERRELCKSVERILAPMAGRELQPDALKDALEQAGQDMPLSGPMIVHLVSHLREWATDVSEVRHWLVCKLENGPESFDRIVSYEHQLQASYQATTGHIIGSLRGLSRLDWQPAFEQICLVEHTLRDEITGDYKQLDFSSRDILRRRVEVLARRFRVPENLVAKQAVELAAAAFRQADAEQQDHAGVRSRQTFIAYYLQEANGMKQLHKALSLCADPKGMPTVGMLQRPSAVYFSLLFGLIAFFLYVFTMWISRGAVLPSFGWGLLGLLILLPAAEWGVGAAHWLIERSKHPQPLLRYDFSQGIPEEAATMVVVPVIWSSEHEVKELADRLELHYLSNRDQHLHFALLGDYADAETEQTPEDAKVLAAAISSIERLNETYRESGGVTFHLFQRKRQWNPREGKWMGWERKRGKLVEFVERLKGADHTSFSHVIGDQAVYPEIRYIITLDADTLLPLESARRMVGTMHLPYNRPRMNHTGTRIVEGYGILQPRIGMSHEASLQSRLTYLWSSDPGVDPYAFAISDPYQDGLGEGIFTGKGIFDVEAFSRILCERIPENHVLSHDLLEGGFLRAGQLSDIELIDDHPATFRAYQMRLHRWVRGDWQLLPWLTSRMANRKGEQESVDLSAVTRWQMVDNLRRSLTPPILLVILLLGVTVLPGSPWRWLALGFGTMLIPMFRQLLSIRHTFLRPKSLAATLGQVLLNIWTLPFQSVLFVDAIVRTIYRLFVSKRHLLEWVSSAEIERLSRGGRQPLIQGMYGGYAWIGLFAIAAFLQETAALQWTIGVLCIVWAAAPIAVRWLNQPVQQDGPIFSSFEEQELKSLAEQIWNFFEEYVTERDSWLPPDNVQLDPPKGIAHRTSPTNIGLYISCALAARDFGFIDTPGLIERLERTLTTIERMEKWEGHLYNWYDTASLAPLPPKYVSTVDSGNFVGCLIAVKEGLAEYLETDQRLDGPLNSNRPADRESLHVAFAEELTPALDGSETQKENRRIRTAGSWQDRGQRIMNRLERMIQETDFRPLYNDKHKLFSLGYHAERQEQDKILYDLAASEARQASFVAIALGQVSVAHWHALGRTMTKIGRNASLLSWSGTMFEYLMPWLFMRTYHNTIWEKSYRSVVDRQIEYAERRGVPFGISESGYYAFDHQMNYQYRAFGVPGLGFKRGLERDLVVSPYAAILALPYAQQKGLESLQQMEKLGARGEYGFYEAIDFTAERMPAHRKYMIVRSFMAHHQGMSLLCLSNLLLPKKIYDRFHRDKRVRSAEMLLQERLPSRPKMIKHPALSRTQLGTQAEQKHKPVVREVPVDTAVPEVCILSNGTYSIMVTNSGSGLSRYNGIAVTRWREDPVLDEWGSYIYIREVSSDALWSPTFQPCRVPSETMKVTFSPDRAAFLCMNHDVESLLEITVSPEWNSEVRRLTLTNKGNEAKIIEITTFTELALTNPLADAAHPAFSKLFIQTEYAREEECLLARRRSREEGENPIWAAHSLMVAGEALGPLEFETDRSSFIGRGHSLAEPEGIRSRLLGKTGSVADPAFVMRRRISLKPGEQVQAFAVTSIADDRDKAIDMVRRFSEAHVVEHSFQLSWNRSLIELRQLQLDATEVMIIQALAGQVMYTSPMRRERMKHIELNEKGQSSLWAYGISGDQPIIAVEIEDSTNLKFVGQLLVAHEYLRRMGFHFDIVILNHSAEGYQQQLQQSLQHLIAHGVDRYGAEAKGIVLVQTDQLPQEDRALLLAAARIHLRADGASLKAQLRWLGKGADLPAKLVTGEQPGYTSSLLEDPVQPQLFNGWGGFSQDGKEYKLFLKNGNHLPAPWSNVIANPQFGTLITERGTGYTWWQNSREFKLTPWSNDPVLDPPGEACYLRDEATGELWSPAPLSDHADKPYHVSHGHGYTTYVHESFGILQEMKVFVAKDDPVKIIELKLTNRTDADRRLSATYYAEWVLGVERQARTPFIATEWDESTKVMLARNKFQETFRDAVAFLGVYPDAAESGGIADSENEAGEVEWSWTADRREFLGRNGTRTSPEALHRERLSRRTGIHYDTCGAVQAKFKLEAGSERTVYIILGCGTSAYTAVQLAERYRHSQACLDAYEQVVSFWDDLLGQIAVETPSKELDIMLNGWLLYQSLSCRIWARSGFYQAGGAYGFRDQLQDSLSMLHVRPDLTRAQILRNASHQYIEGDVQHWWHEETERGIRTHFSDDLLWLPYAVTRYIEHTGDAGILEEVVPFLQSEPLQEGELERYEPTVVSTDSGTVYEHCIRAIERALRWTGEHGLPLIGIGDWNDGMSRVGAEFRGESVWLGWFICDILNRFIDLVDSRGDEERAHRYREVRQKLPEAIDQYAWDGQWYRRAFTDAGTWLGSIHNEECRIDAIAQSWAVISGAAPHDKALKAMQSYDRELVDRSLSVVHLLTPPFDRTEPSPGYIQGYPPGIRENGAQYTHGVLWGIIAWCRLGEGDKAFELFHMLNPINHTRTPNEVRRYMGEPYVMAADVYTAEPNKGRAGWTWYTGAAGWMYQVGIEWILGLRRAGERLLILPCIPSDWPELSMRYRYGSTTYHIQVNNPERKQTGCSSFEVDGRPIDLSQPEMQEGPWIKLADDGQDHYAVLTM